MDLKDTNLVADEGELNAFVDGCLAGTRRQAVLERLARDPAAKARVDALGRQNALLAALRQSLNIGHASLSLFVWNRNSAASLPMRPPPTMGGPKHHLRELDPSRVAPTPALA